MNVKNNYDECLTNLACSIRKYFGLEYHHKTLEYIDKILEEKSPNNVILILYDGMGSRILDRTLAKDSFFIKNMYKEITTVFPATTTAATTSIRTGLNPVEHSWLGWNTYIEPIDKTITLFRDREKCEEDVCKEFLEIKNKISPSTIVSEIVNETKYYAKEIYPFTKGNATVYSNLDEMINIVLEETQKGGKKFLYVYNDEPDHTMHDFGPDSNEAKSLIEERNLKTSELCDNLADSLVIVVADHGHIKIDNIFLNDYPELLNMLERTPSIETRAISFKVKKEFINDFEIKFKELLGQYFSLYSKDEIINSGLFGDGIPHELFNSAIGDYIAIAEDSNKGLISDGDKVLSSHHAGYTDDEIYVPLIIIDKT